MYINRTLLLIACILMVFSPVIADWLASTEPDWYRPYQLWLVLILATYWNQRSRNTDEL